MTRREYYELFLTVRDRDGRKVVFIDDRVHEKLGLLVTRLRNTKFNPSTYVNNILLDHFSRYDEIYQDIFNDPSRG